MPASGSCCATANPYRWLQKSWRRSSRSSRIGIAWSRKTNCSSRSGVTRLWKREGSPGTSPILRKVLGEKPDDHQYIVTVPARGYRFVADVRERRTSWRIAGRAAAGTSRAAMDQGGVFRRVAGWSWAVWLRSASRLSPTSLRPVRATDPGRTAITSLAVLPLDNLSGDPAHEYLADGMTEALITDLGRIGSVRVIARASVMKYKGAHASPVRSRESWECRRWSPAQCCGRVIVYGLRRS